MFSSALTLTDLNDFITPSQACIKPVEEVKPEELTKQPGSASQTQIQVDASGAYYEVDVGAASSTTATAKPRRKLEQAQISLNDCLACSGCITSAESVLITMQSHNEVMDVLSNNPKFGPLRKTPILSISPQSIASLASSTLLPPDAKHPTRSILRRVRTFCKFVLGFEHIFDTTFARHLALKEHVQEFEERKRGDTGAGKLPMLASACPGWVCYAEKTHSEMLPFIARTKSPQQVMGTLVKEWMGKKWGKTPDQVYHVSVMPCYDKKLEASRTDFYNDLYSTRDVDCVITTSELELLMQEHNWDLSRPVDHEDEESDPSLSLEEQIIPQLMAHAGSSSGSYMQSLINAAHQSHPEDTLELTTKAIRTADYEEHTLTQDTGVPVFRGAKCYGFRNLQNVVRKIGRDAGVQTSKGAAGRLTTRGGVRRGAASGALDKSYEYVEVMACPGGCINGGGQLRPRERRDAKQPSEGSNVSNSVTSLDREAGDGSQAQGYANKWSDREWMAKVEAMYWNGLPTPPPSPSPAPTRCVTGADHATADALAICVLQELCKPKRATTAWNESMDDDAEARRRKYFRTEYHAVESEVLGIAVKW